LRAKGRHITKVTQKSKLKGPSQAFVNIIISENARIKSFAFTCHSDREKADSDKANSDNPATGKLIHFRQKA